HARKIGHGRAVLAGDDGALVVRIEGAGMFATGSDAIRARYRAVVDRVGQALGPEAGRVVVVAHTDDQTPRGGPLPTPEALTEARAVAVLKILERTLGTDRLTAEGRGEREPLAPNTTPANRGANRRVDVRLYPE
ncbi:OmpA family protein, partial [Azospirillum isscasi]